MAVLNDYGTTDQAVLDWISDTTAILLYINASRTVGVIS